MKDESKEMVVPEGEKKFELVSHDPDNMLMDTTGFNQAWRVATMFAKSDFVPNTEASPFKGRPENCMVAFTMADQMGVHPFFLMKNLFNVHGKPSIETQLAIGLINRSNQTEGRIWYVKNGKDGPDRGWIAKVKDSGGQIFEVEMTEKIAKENGWWAKAQSHWPKNFDLMCRYRAAMWLIRLHYPDLIMGLQSVEESRDVGPGEGDGEIIQQSASIAEDLAPEPGTGVFVEEKKPEGIKKEIEAEPKQEPETVVFDESEKISDAEFEKLEDKATAEMLEGTGLDRKYRKTGTLSEAVKANEKKDETAVKVHVRELNEIKRNDDFGPAIDAALEAGDINHEWLKTTGEELARTTVRRIQAHYDKLTGLDERPPSK